jgi:hypothetical protein
VIASSTTLDKDKNDSDDNSGGKLEEKEDDTNSPASKCPYTELLPTFVSITDLVQTEGDLAFVRKGMKEMYSHMLKRRKRKAGCLT